MLAGVTYTVLRPDELEWSKPSAGDQSRGILRLSDRLRHMRANIWRLPPGTSGRRHAERVQEEIFVVLEGTATMALGDPPRAGRAGGRIGRDRRAGDGAPTAERERA